MNCNDILYFLSKRLCCKRKWSSNGELVSLNKREYGLSAQVFINFFSLISSKFLKFCFVWYFHSKVVQRIYSKIFGTLKYDWVVNTSEMFSILLLINSSVTTGLSVSLLIISVIISSMAIINTSRSFPELYYHLYN